MKQKSETNEEKQRATRDTKYEVKARVPREQTGTQCHQLSTDGIRGGARGGKTVSRFGGSGGRENRANSVQQHVLQAFSHGTAVDSAPVAPCAPAIHRMGELKGGGLRRLELPNLLDCALNRISDEDHFFANFLRVETDLLIRLSREANHDEAEATVRLPNVGGVQAEA